MDKDVLTALVAEGLCAREISERLGLGVWTVRAALRRHGIETRVAQSRRLNAEARSTGDRIVNRRCERHGLTAFRRDIRGTYRCAQCNGERVMDRRRRIKEILVREAGGSCRICGYDRCLRAMEFHHHEPATKEFGIALSGHARSLERARAEARKCILLCSNCHMEVEAGFTPLPR